MKRDIESEFFQFLREREEKRIAFKTLNDEGTKIGR